MTVAVVTGANRGLGLAMAVELVARGVTVQACCRRPDEAAELHAVVDGSDGSVVEMDVARAASVTAAAEQIGKRTSVVDLLINNAAIGAPDPAHSEAAEGPLANLEADAVVAVLRTNSLGPALVTQALVPLLARSTAGARVVNVTSDLGSVSADVSEGSIAYAMSKAALHMLTRKVALELEPLGVTVLALHPGSVRTRLGGPAAEQPVEVAARRSLDVIRGVGLDRTGCAVTADGTPLPW